MKQKHLPEVQAAALRTALEKLDEITALLGDVGYADYPYGLQHQLRRVLSERLAAAESALWTKAGLPEQQRRQHENAS